MHQGERVTIAKLRWLLGTATLGEAVAVQLRPVRVAGDLRGRSRLRPAELFGLEWRDDDREAGVVYVRRAFVNRRLKHRSQGLAEPSSGLEPEIPSLPCAPIGNRSQPSATVLACFRPFPAQRVAIGCHRLQPRGSF